MRHFNLNTQVLREIVGSPTERRIYIRRREETHEENKNDKNGRKAELFNLNYLEYSHKTLEALCYTMPLLLLFSVSPKDVRLGHLWDYLNQDSGHPFGPNNPFLFE